MAFRVLCLIVGFFTVVLSLSLYARGGFSATSSSFLSLLFYNFFHSATCFFSNHTLILCVASLPHVLPTKLEAFFSKQASNSKNFLFKYPNM
jgi:hypothetical protein